MCTRRVNRSLKPIGVGKHHAARAKKRNAQDNVRFDEDINDHPTHAGTARGI